ncbi:hypothetical protein V6N13_069951 [Hibiscus sabdariffa]
MSGKQSRELSIISAKLFKPKSMPKTSKPSHPDETMVNLSPALVTCSLKLPFIHVTRFAGLRAIFENVASSKRVHFIDMAIRSGAYCIGMSSESSFSK